MPDHSDGPLPDDIDTATDEAEPAYAAAVALYFEALPCWPIMTAGPED